MSISIQIADEIRKLKGISIRELAKTAEVNQAHLSGWFREIPGRMGMDKIERVLKVLGLADSNLLSGIHRWMIPSQMTSDVEKAEYLVRELCPGGGKLYPLRSANIVQAIIPASFGSFLPWMLWVLVPIASPQVRIVFSIKPSPKTLNFLGSIRSLYPKYFGGILPDGSSPDEIPSSAWIPIPPEIFDRIKSDSDMTVPDLDAILGISGSSNWTWERLNAVLQGKGITPEETARKMGIL
ncbi:MAG: helix-turn-helix domain-containing protein [Leptospirales bacterium]